MNMTQQIARLGLYFLKAAIIEILFYAQNEGPLQPNEIRKRMGILEETESSVECTHFISNILFLLKEDGFIENITGKEQGWIITKMGILLYLDKYHPMNL